MEKSRVFKLPLSEGVQAIRLDSDSLDYDWKSPLDEFHGTLPYENLRMTMRVTRRSKGYGRAALLLVLVFLLLCILFASPQASSSIVVAGVCVINVASYLVFQQVRSGSICVQIDPPPFGFGSELPIPDTEAGRTFLKELEGAWKASLSRRFLVRDSADPSLLSQRINWLESVGVLTADEAAAERSLLDGSSGRKLIEDFAVN